SFLTSVKLLFSGLRAIAEGKVAAVVLAGGQATRLGASKPKDCNSLFALQAARIARLQVLAAKQFPSYRPIIHWIIMTSASTEADTKRHLEEIAQMSELTMDQITIFNQGELPCITFDEKLILSSKSKIATAPDGNGGLYEAIRPHLPRFRSIGIRYFHVYCVDNILCRVADPHFIGYCIEKNADCAAKVVEKVDPGERVGVICKEDGKIKVIEYTELPRDLAEKRTESGKLVFRAGNIANHFFSLEFLEKVCSDDYPIIYHLAFKKIPFVDENGTIIKPNSENGYKLEKFIFDVFEFSQNFFVWEVPRAEEFSPLKNAENAGKECLSTCLRDLFAEHRRWLKCKSDDDRNLFVHPNNQVRISSYSLSVQFISYNFI
ncbi:unnamed protein product, partial [Dracunculus medinensis]|uniref:UDP-N-acetylglucosamine diphosphorylase n=1 Tax=Dracunculus medinensis TaxID=318479 RepID=A0A0N4U5B3_DRAME